MDERTTIPEHHRGAGGTEGGVGMFIFGVGLAAAGAYLLTTRVMVQTSGFRLWGFNSFGLSLIPFLLGIGLLFFNGRSIAGKALTFLGLVIIFAGIISNLDIYFRQTSLFETLLMLGMVAAGVGLVARAIRPM
ncbi:MAG TPA: hypothetical protein VFR81_07465 [Longimicrobium sp.]|jgi:uncharacterized protein|nr:hypothetical protein [Longimicrobium sp.]